MMITNRYKNNTNRKGHVYREKDNKIDGSK